MHKIITLILICLCMCSCSPQRKLQRLLTKHPELMRVEKTPIVVTHTDTIVFEEEVAGTAFKIETEKEKVLAETDENVATLATVSTKRATATLSYNKLADSYSLEVKAKADSVPVTHTDTVNAETVFYNTEVKEVEPPRKWYERVLVKFGAFCLFLMLLVLISLIITKSITKK
ncbi:MAG: hypothetical protein J6X12_10320 [Paludibacteraceae bacterium]|nr:hypothetical protein [Paludibacteraceae bacterium]